MLSLGLSLGGLGFAAPWALATLVLLPALWWLLRLTPPAPARIVFPPFRLLAALVSREQSARRTPWWLLALRLLLATALILGIAGPVLTGGEDLTGSGPVILITDNGWAAAPDWEARQAALNLQIDRAERAQRPVVLLPTAPADDAPLPAPKAVPASAARDAAQKLRPQPWATDRAAATAPLAELANRQAWPPAAVIWVSDGLDQPPGSTPVADWVQQLGKLGRVTVLTPPDRQQPLLLRLGDASAGGNQTGIPISVLRARATGEAPVRLRLLDADGVPLSRQEAHFADGERRLALTLDLPAELAARLGSVQVEGTNSAGSVLLIDARSQRRAVGLVGETEAGSQPLLGAEYYLERALQPFAEVRRGEVSQLLSRPLAMLVMADVGSLDPATAAAVETWVEAGGVLLRFAGPRLAREAAGDDPLLPVALRAGDRVIGGALSWSGTGTLAAFEARGPFAGLAAGHDITVRRQVIAEPSLDVAERTWAQLEDGTPLITGARRGAGWVVLVHTTASPDWSDLPLSGVFVDLLRRILGLAAGGAAQAQAPLLPPLETLDGFGRLGRPAAGTRAIAGPDFAAARVQPHQPPGYYGTAEAKLALNLGPSVADPAALPPLPAGVRSLALGTVHEWDLRPELLGLALVLALADFAISLWMRHRPQGASPARRIRRAALAALLVLAAPQPGHAQQVIADGTAEAASLSTRLAYIRTGDAKTDQISEAALAGLSAIVNQRTAAELDAPDGVDPEHTELAFYPLLYWPIGDVPQRLTPAAARRLNSYMRSGGTIVFDTRGRADADQRAALRDLARALDLPPLVPMPDDHVLHRSYYLLSGMPGRHAGGTVWVEQPDDSVNDGVSSVIAGSSDWAGAWAVDDALRPMFAVSPGGERQRELAYRFGVNLVMYVLTGNYKADQVHLPTILERLAP